MAFQILTGLMLVGNIKPLVSAKQSKSEILNEITLIFVIYCFFFCSPWCPDLELRFRIGYIIIAIVGGHFFINLLFIVIK